jgi:hypothetical protein
MVDIEQNLQEKIHPVNGATGLIRKSFSGEFFINGSLFRRFIFNGSKGSRL